MTEDSIYIIENFGRFSLVNSWGDCLEGGIYNVFELVDVLYESYTDFKWVDIVTGRRFMSGDAILSKYVADNDRSISFFPKGERL